MFGSKRKKYKEIEAEFMNIMTLLGSGGDQRASDAANSLEAAMDLSHKYLERGFGDKEIVHLLVAAGLKSRASTSGAKLAFRLVALIHECRQLNTAPALRLANNIQDIVYDTRRKFSNDAIPSNQDEETDSGHSDNYQVAVDVLIGVLRELRIFDEHSGRLYRSHALGFIWGWCDANTQIHSAERNTEENLAKCTTATLSVLLNIKGITRPEAEEFLETLIEMQDGNDQFKLGLICGGQALFDLVNNGNSNGATEDIALVFGPDGFNSLQQLRARYSKL